MALADWDPRLLSPERALHLAGDWPLYATHELAGLAQYGDQPDQWQVNLRCGKDGQSVGLLSGPVHTTIGDLLSGVVRHLVTAHDLSLSGASEGHTTPDAGGPLAASPSRDHARLIDAITEEQAHG